MSRLFPLSKEFYPVKKEFAPFSIFVNVRDLLVFKKGRGVQESNLKSQKFLPFIHDRLSPKYSQYLNQSTASTDGSIVSEIRLEK